MSFVCVICLSQLTNPEEAPGGEGRAGLHGGDVVVTKCGHLFHRKCIGGWLIANRPNGGPTCPTCKAKVSGKNFQRVFPPDSGENLELQLEEEREKTRELRAKVESYEKRIMELDEKCAHDDKEHTRLRTLYTMKEGEATLLHEQMDFVLNLHRTSECMNLATRKGIMTTNKFFHKQVIDLSGSDDEEVMMDSFIPIILSNGTGFCIEARDLTTFVKTFVNVSVATQDGDSENDAHLPTHAFIDFEGKPKVLKFGMFYVGTFDGESASVANIVIEYDLFNSNEVTPALIQQFFAQFACKQLNARGGLNLDFFHIKIMKNLHITFPDKDGKENVKKINNENASPPAKRTRSMIKKEAMEGVKIKKERVVIDNITID